MNRNDVIDVALDLCLDEDAIRSYSGRGMYGAECLALVGDDLGALLELAAILWRDHDLDLSAASMDAMGLGMVLYFPGTTLDEEEDTTPDFEPSPDPNWMNP